MWLMGTGTAHSYRKDGGLEEARPGARACSDSGWRRGCRKCQFFPPPPAVGSAAAGLQLPSLTPCPASPYASAFEVLYRDTELVIGCRHRSPVLCPWTPANPHGERGTAQRFRGTQWCSSGESSLALEEPLARVIVAAFFAPDTGTEAHPPLEPTDVVPPVCPGCPSGKCSDP